LPSRTLSVTPSVFPITTCRDGAIAPGRTGVPSFEERRDSFMSALYVTVCLTLAAILAGGAGRSAAKPPDLPLDLKATCQPVSGEPDDPAVVYLAGTPVDV